MKKAELETGKYFITSGLYCFMKYRFVCGDIIDSLGDVSSVLILVRVAIPVIDTRWPWRCIFSLDFNVFQTT